MSSEPQKSPAADRALLLPILLGAFSLCGILLVLTIGRFRTDRSLAPAPDTATPFQYQLIGTEPGVSTADPATGEPGIETPDESFGSPAPGLLVTAQQGAATDSNSSGAKTNTKTPSSAIQTAAGNGTDPIIILNPGSRTATPLLVVIERSHTPTRTPGPTLTITPSRTRVTSTFTQEIPGSGTPSATPSRTPTPSRTFTTVPTGPTQAALGPGIYDDSHPLFAYNGWTSVTEPSAYQSTLHVSITTGSTITFRFTGQQLRLFFQNSPSFGTIRINIGGLNFDLDETDTTEYVSAILAQGTYTVVITHIGGGSVNIDQVVIEPLPTPTSTN